MYEIGLQQELAPNLGITVTDITKTFETSRRLQLFLKTTL